MNCMNVCHPLLGCLSVCVCTGDEGHVGCDRAVLSRQRAGDHDGLRAPEGRREGRLRGHGELASAAARPAARAGRRRQQEEEEPGQETVRGLPIELDGVQAAGR